MSAATVTARVIEPDIRAQRLPQAEPCVLVIFGATGDLARRMLIPALYELRGMGCLGDHCELIGTGRTPLSDAEFRSRMHDAVAKASGTRGVDHARWQDFERRLGYIPGDPRDPAFHRMLADRLEAGRRDGASANRLFYVATPPSVVRQVVEGLGAAGLGRSQHGWSRIVLEKPFGRDLESAGELSRHVNAAFPEEAVFRIDHYLGKETVQNILVFRFGNSIFEPVWNRNYIDYVDITAAESLGVEHRGAFYEETGALRDMVANHLLQLVALAAMEPPPKFSADAVRDAKVQLLHAIAAMDPHEVARRTVRGQYGSGRIEGEPVPAYRDEADVSAASTVETFAAIEFQVDNWRWAGVPFYVRTGKRLGRRMTEISVHFKRPPQALFSAAANRTSEPNLITLRIQPDEGITITFGAKQPGPETRPIPVEAVFSYASTFAAELPDAYGTLLLDAMNGDATLFTRADEIDAQWRIITPIQEAWARFPRPAFPNYAAGSDGPAEANALVQGPTRRWCPICPAAGGPD